MNHPHFALRINKHGEKGTFSGLFPSGVDFRKIGEIGAFFGKIEMLHLNSVKVFLTALETLQKFFKLSNTPKGHVCMLEEC